MKRIFALMLVLCMALTVMVACNNSSDNADDTTPAGNDAVETTTAADAGNTFDPAAKSEGVMTYADYDAAAMDGYCFIWHQHQSKSDPKGKAKKADRTVYRDLYNLRILNRP